jgi:hypothetical protein
MSIDTRISRLMKKREEKISVGCPFKMCSVLNPMRPNWSPLLYTYALSCPLLDPCNCSMCPLLYPWFPNPCPYHNRGDLNCAPYLFPNVLSCAPEGTPCESLGG